MKKPNFRPVFYLLKYGYIGKILPANPTRKVSENPQHSESMYIKPYFFNINKVLLNKVFPEEITVQILPSEF